MPIVFDLQNSNKDIEFYPTELIHLITVLGSFHSNTSSLGHPQLIFTLPSARASFAARKGTGVDIRFLFTERNHQKNTVILAR